MICQRCGGTLVGDGYTSVMHCEFADPSKYEYHEPDAPTVFCSPEEVVRVSSDWWDHQITELKQPRRCFVTYDEVGLVLSTHDTYESARSAVINYAAWLSANEGEER